MANMLNLFRDGAVGFIDWLDRSAWAEHKSKIQRSKYDPPERDCDKKSDEPTVSAIEFIFGRERPLESVSDQICETTNVTIATKQ